MRMRIVLAGTAIGTVTGVGLSRVARWRRMWGVDPSEAAKPLRGDDLVPVTTAVETRGITIDAPPEAVWPWLLQMGYGRGGWYSYDQLDMGGTSAVTLKPEWATLAVGDIMPTSPGTGFEVKAVEPGGSLVLFTDTALVESQAASAGPESVPPGLAATGAFLGTAPQDFSASWAFVLEPLDGGRTRLIERFRVRFGNGGPQFRIIGPIMGFGVFVMMRRQMLGIRDRAVLTAVAPRLSDETTEKPRHTPANGRALEPAGRTEVLASA
ncbi:MAG: hypothetical protein ACJ77U_09590 [Chloroflexota bacterium]|jgi:hypothetical protein